MPLARQVQVPVLFAVVAGSHHQGLLVRGSDGLLQGGIDARQFDGHVYPGAARGLFDGQACISIQRV